MGVGERSGAHMGDPYWVIPAEITSVWRSVTPHWDTFQSGGHRVTNANTARLSLS